METNLPAKHFFNFCRFLIILFLLVLGGKSFGQGSGITRIFTDYNGYWTSSSTTFNPVKPANDHNLLGFTWNGTTYATGVNNAILTANSIAFTPVNFQAFPVRNVTLSGSNCKIALGQLKDGVNNGMPATAPFALPPRISDFLTDGIQGLNIGTGVANVPTGTPLTFDFGGIVDAAKINDGIPDVLVSQIASPDAVLDQVYFTDAGGNRVGNIISIDQTLVPAVGNWTADFYELNGTLATNFTNTDRPIRVWAADVSAFGITTANYSTITSLVYLLKGSSDPAFLAFNTGIIQVVSANDDDASTNIGTPVAINVLSNDTPPGSIDATSVAVTTAPLHGTYTIASTGVVTYTPTSGYYGTDSFVYTVSNVGNTQSDNGTVTINVGSAVAAPVFNTGLVSSRCIGSGSSTYTATAVNSTSISYALNPSNAGSINASTGLVTWLSTFSGTATITAIASGANGPKSSTYTVTVSALPATPTITASGSLTFCNGGNVILTSSAATGNQWYKNGVLITNETGTTYTATQSGNYTVVSTNSNGCSSAASTATVVTVNALPFVDVITGNTTINTGATAQLSNTTANGVWSSSNTLIATVSPTGLVTGIAAGNATVTYNYSNGTCSNAVTAAITVTALLSQTITFTSLPVKTYGDVDFSLAATSSSGLAVSYTSSNPAVATVDASGTIHILTAGTTNITASQPGNSNYNAATPATQTLMVNKASLTITADNQTKTYGAANPALTLNYTGFVNAETTANLNTQATASTLATTTSAAGTYPINVNAASSNNYAFTFVAGTLTIGQTSQTLSFNSVVSSKVYGDADFSLSATTSSGLPIVYTSSDPTIATIDAAGTVHILTAGSVTITASQPGNSNYSGATAVTQIISINKASLIIAANNQTTTYGTVPALTLTYTGFVNNENSTSLAAQPAISTTANTNSTVGIYPITVSGAAGNNYTITYAQGTLTIGQSAQTISFNTLSAKTYGDTDFTLAASATSGSSVVYTSSNPAIATVDVQGIVHILTAGSVTITASQPGNSNYAAAVPVSQILTVNKASLTITAVNQSKVYNTANPALAISYSGFVNGENSTSLTASPTASTTATAASAVGSYAITVAGAVAANYQITYVNGVLTIGQNSPAITFNALPAKVYGDADFNLSATSTSGLPVTFSSSNPTVATVNAQGIVHILSAGTSVITASQAGNGNYSPAVSGPQTLTVNRAALTISANNQTKQYAENNPAFTVSYSGFVNGENSANLTTQPIVSTSATTASAAGTYPITVADAAAANYQITYVNGALTIFPGTQTISFTATPRTYGDPDFTLNATASSGLPVFYSSSNTAVATVDANGLVHIITAGNVIITASQPGNGNFIATTNINQQLTINKAVLVVKADDLTKTYGAANPPLTVTYNGFVYGDTKTSLSTQPVVSTTVTAASVVGIYPVTIAGAASRNYSFTYQAGTLTVGQNSQTITFASLQNKIYGDADFTLAGSSTSGLPLSYTSSDPSVATVDAGGRVHILSAGTSTITASQPGNGNYSSAVDATQILMVNKASLILTIANQNKVYGATNPSLTFTYTGFVNGDNSTSLITPPVISTTATATSDAGTYPIAINNAIAANYAITYTPGTLTIAKAVLTVTADNKSRVYGLANPPFTVTYSGFVNGGTVASLSTSPQLTTTANAASPAGVYPITISGGSAANYNFAFVPGTLTVTNATVSSVSLAQVTLYENQPAGTPAGTLAAVSLDPNATYTYTLVAGTGSTDNALFSIQGNKLVTTQSLDYEQKASYSILVRATNQYGLYLDQTFTINLSDVNEAPTLAAIGNQSVCNIPSNQNITLTGITSGPETAQTTAVTVSSGNAALFSSLSVSSVSNGSATLTYQLAQPGTAVVTVTVKDSGGTANGGTDSFSQTFTLTSNAAPVAAISSDKGLQISKGETITLTATGGSVYSWDTTPNVSGSASTAVIQLRPGQTTTYQVKVSNASGCSSTGSITIQVNDDYSLIRPSNILTPNGDGKNDTWVVKNLDLYPNNTVSIFDRGGRLLNKVNHYNNDWDGMYNGVPLAEGTYYYIIDFGPGKGPMKGFITILRNR